MRKLKNYQHFTIFLIFLPVFLFGQDQKITHSATKLTLEDQFSLSIFIPYTKNLKISAFPEIADFSKKSTVFIREDSIIRITQYYQPRKAGQFYLNPFSLWINKDRIAFDHNVLIEVKNYGKPKLTKTIAEEFTSPDLRASLQAAVNQSEVYNGAPITYSLYLLVNAASDADYNFIDLHDQITSISKQIQPKNTLSKNLSIPAEIKTDSIQIEGNNFRRYQLFTATYFPMSENQIKFSAVNFKLLSYLEKKGTGIIERQDTIFKLQAPPIKVKVKPLPGSTETSGLLPGNFKLKETLFQKNTDSESYLYSIIISGDGNLALAYSPSIKRSSEFEIYPAPIQKDPVGSKSFNFYLIPKTTKDIHLQSFIYWPFFNIKTDVPDTLRPKTVLKNPQTATNSEELVADDEFLNLIQKENNKLRKQEEDIMLKIFTNLVILFMFAVTAILIIRK